MPHADIWSESSQRARHQCQAFTTTAATARQHLERVVGKKSRHHDNDDNGDVMVSIGNHVCDDDTLVILVHLRMWLMMNPRLMMHDDEPYDA
eukprot:7640401-Karenia_brevis.AAC.1